MNDSRWQALGVWYALRPARERLILLVAAVVLLAYVWFVLAFETLEASQASTERQLVQLTQENAALALAHENLRVAADEQPNAALERQIARLTAQNARLDVEVGAMSVTLVEPERMAMVLSRVMARQPNIELIGMQNRPAEQLFFGQWTAVNRLLSSLWAKARVEGPLSRCASVPCRHRGARCAVFLGSGELSGRSTQMGC